MAQNIQVVDYEPPPKETHKWKCVLCKTATHTYTSHYGITTTMIFWREPFGRKCIICDEDTTWKHDDEGCNCGRSVNPYSNT